MAQTIKLKRSALSGASGIPSTSDIALGEIAINTYYGKLYVKKDNGVDAASIVELFSADKLPLAGGTLTGTLNISSGNLQIGGTTVINSSREIQGILAIRHANSNAQILDNDNDTYTIFNDPEGSNRLLIGDSGDAATYIRNTNLYLQDTGGTTNFQTNSAWTNIARGNLQIGGTNVINSGRALYNLESFKLADAKKAYFGSSNDLEIYHDGNNSYITDVGTGNLYIASNQLIINNAANSENMARFAQDGAVTLYHNGIAKVATTTTGIDITGTVTADGTTSNSVPKYTFSGDTDTGLGHVGANAVGLIAGGSRKFYVNATHAFFQNLTGGVDVPSLNIASTTVIDSSRNLTNIGTISSGVITATGGTSGQWNTAYGWGDHASAGYTTAAGTTYTASTGLTLTGQAFSLTDTNAKLNLSGGAMTGAITTNSTFDGVDIAVRDAILTTTTTTANAALPKAGGTMTGDLVFGDNDKATFGDSDDLKIYHNGTNSYIDDAGTGWLNIRGSAIGLDKYTGETMATFIADGAVTLYHNNIAKFATTSTGIDVTGSVTGTQDFHGAGYRVYNSSLSNYGKFTADSLGSLIMSTGAGEAARLTPTGLGIGKTSPVTPLDIAFPLLTSATQKNELVLESRANGATAQTGALTGITINNRTNLYVAGSFNSTAGIYGVNLDAGQYGRSLGLDFYTSATDATATAKLRIDGAGNVGIGNTNSNGPLTVTSNSSAIGINLRGRSSDGISQLAFMSNDGNTNYSQIQSRSSELYVKTIANIPISFHTNNAERMRLDTSGRLLLNATSTAFSDKLYVNGNAYTTGGWRVGSGATYTGKIYNSSGVMSIETDSNRDIKLGSSTYPNILAIDSSARNVGINILAPVYPLDVRNPSDINQTFRVLYPDADTVEIGTSRMNSGAVQGLSINAQALTKFAIGGVEKMRLTSAGYVGIGTTAPSEKLEVSGNIMLSDPSPQLKFETGASHYNWQLAAQESTTASFEISVGSADADGSNDTYTPKLLINQAGNVGIGTTAPSSVLSGSNTNLTISDADGADIRLKRSSGADFTLGVTSSNTAYVWNAGSHNMLFGTAGTERMRLTSAGDIGIGTASPAHKLDVLGNTRIGGNTTGTTLTIEASDTAGSPAMTAQIQMKGYEGRGIGTFFTDSSYAGEEWYAGLPYAGSFNTYQIGYDASGSQAEYTGNAVLTIKDTGFMGIGTASPSQKVHAASTGITYFRATGGSGNTGIDFGQHSNGSAYIWHRDNTSLIIGTNATERMRVDNSGNVLVSTTSPIVANSSTNVGTSIGLGLIESARAGVVAQLNRHTSDGDVLELQKAGTAIGSLGVANSNNLTIGGTVANHGGLEFGTLNIMPKVSGHDLGVTTRPFGALHLTDVSHKSETATLATVTQTSIATFAHATYGAAKFIVTAKDGVNRQITEILVTHNGTTAIATEYGTIVTSGTLAAYDVDISGANVRLLATSSSTSSTVYKIVETLIEA